MAQKKSVEVVDFAIREVKIPIVSVSPLIVHAFSKKAQGMIEGKQQGQAKNKKHELRNPEDDYEQARHKSPLGFDGFPAGGFKKAMVRGAKMVGLIMKDAQTSFFVKADCEEKQLVRIDGEPHMNTSMVRIGMGTADVRYRPEYPKWSAVLTIEFNEGMLSLDQIFQMVKAAGYGCGIGELRPEKCGGSYGRFKLANEN